MKAIDAYRILEIGTRALIEKCDSLRQERDEARKLYHDLIMQVAQKFPDESRHDTAKRYIHSAEHRDNDPVCAEHPMPPNAGNQRGA